MGCFMTILTTCFEKDGNTISALPQSDGPGHRVIAMNDRKDPFDKLIHVKDLLQVFLTLLGYFQDTKTQEVVPEIRQSVSKKLRKQKWLVLI